MIESNLVEGNQKLDQGPRSPDPRPVDHRRLPRLGRHRGNARRAGGRGPQAPECLVIPQVRLISARRLSKNARLFAGKRPDYQSIRKKSLIPACGDFRTAILRQPSFADMDLTSESSQSVITCRNSQGTELTANLLRIKRYSVVFEVYNPYSILQLSEVLSDFRIMASRRLLYHGKAVVSNLLNTGIVLVCEAMLEDGWVEVDFLSTRQRNGRSAEPVRRVHGANGSPPTRCTIRSNWWWRTWPACSAACSTG